MTSRLTVLPFDVIQLDDGSFTAFGIPYHASDPELGGNYTVTTKDGVTYVINGMSGKLSTVSDLNGNTLNFSDSGVTNIASGVGVTILRDPQGRVTAVIDPMGHRINYDYDGNGDLVSVTDRQTNTTQFVYHPTRRHYLTNVIDAHGRNGVRVNYDDQGRHTKHVDAAGNPV